MNRDEGPEVAGLCRTHRHVHLARDEAERLFSITVRLGRLPKTEAVKPEAPRGRLSHCLVSDGDGLFAPAKRSNHCGIHHVDDRLRVCMPEGLGNRFGLGEEFLLVAFTGDILRGTSGDGAKRSADEQQASTAHN